MKEHSKNKTLVSLLILGFAAGLFTLVLPRIAQDPSYHDFADDRSFLDIPNTMDVVSNVPLIALGVYGILLCLNIPGPIREAGSRRLAFLFSVIVFLTGIGSFIYHLQPNNDTLVRDRLPLSVMPMIVFLIVLADRVSPRLANILVLPTLVAGPASVYLWWLGEQQGGGDLRLYGLLKLLPVILVPATILLEPCGRIRNADLWKAFSWYVLAKLVEFLDEPVYEWTGWISGHTLKHLFACVAVWYLLNVCRSKFENRQTSEKQL